MYVFGIMAFDVVFRSLERVGKALLSPITSDGTGPEIRLDLTKSGSPPPWVTLKPDYFTCSCVLQLNRVLYN